MRLRIGIKGVFVIRKWFFTFSEPFDFCLYASDVSGKRLEWAKATVGELTGHKLNFKDMVIGETYARLSEIGG